MRKLTNITNQPRQKFSFRTDEQERIDFEVWFDASQEMWFYNLICGDFKLYGQAIYTSINMLDRYHSIIKFGLMVTTKDNLDPFRISDFQEGYASMYVLNKSEVAEVINWYETE